MKDLHGALVAVLVAAALVLAAVYGCRGPSIAEQRRECVDAGGVVVALTDGPGCYRP